MDKTTHKIRHMHWNEIITQCQNRPEGMNAKQWLQNNSISEKSYYYWLRKLRKNTYEQMQEAVPAPAPDPGGQSFAEIPVPVKRMSDDPVGIHSPAAVIRTAGVAVVLSDGISDRMLEKILREVLHA